MSSRPPTRRPTPTNKYGVPQPLPNMATPRRPEPGNSLGAGGVFILLVVLGGLGWLMMLVFRWGPYAAGPDEGNLLGTETPAIRLTAGATSTTTPQPLASATVTATPTVTLTPTLAPQPYVMIGEPDVMSSVRIRPQLGCEWLVIAGQVWDLQDEPVTGYTLHLFGELGGYTIDQYKITGSAVAYGESGYEFALKDLVLTSVESLYLQLEDRDGVPLSHPVAVQTYQDCQKNLILVNFKQVR